jgi:hypothetical protein
MASRASNGLGFDSGLFLLSVFSVTLWLILLLDIGDFRSLMDEILS